MRVVTYTKHPFHYFLYTTHSSATLTVSFAPILNEFESEDVAMVFTPRQLSLRYAGVFREKLKQAFPHLSY